MDEKERRDSSPELRLPKEKQLEIRRKMIISKQKDEETNDFDLNPEKSAPPSTIRDQMKTTQGLMERKKLGSSCNILQTFDRLKIWIDLAKYGEKIGFKRGRNLKRSDYPSSSPYEQKMKMKGENGKDWLADEPDYNDFQTYEDDVLDAEAIVAPKKKYSYGNYSISYSVYKKTLGINNVYIQNDRLVIDVTGKLMCDFAELGLLHLNNIEDAIRKLQDLDLFKFNIDVFLQYANFYLGDLTMDIEMINPKQVKRMINAMSSYYPLYSNSHTIKKYKRHGLFYRKKSEDAGYSFSAYDKGSEISHNYTKLDKKVRYTDTIGEPGELRAKRTLRLELHLHNLAATRKLLDLKNKGYGIIPLLDVLTCKKPVMLDILREIGVREEKIYQALSWYKPKSNLLSKSETFIAEENFTELLVAERLAEIIIENNYDIEMAKNHILTEYDIDVGSKLEDKLFPIIRKNMYNFLAYRKPKTQTLILILLTRLSDMYYGDEYIPGRVMYVPDNETV